MSLVFVTGCTGERISSELEFQAVGACAAAIEERLGTELPPGWQYLKEERDGQAFMKAWAPDRDTESTPPDFVCSVVPDESAEQGVRVVRLEAGARR